ncbi:MAG: ribonuclease III [Microbacteriaceae bacterium]
MSADKRFRSPSGLSDVLEVSLPDSLLQPALTHRSYAYEHSVEHYERMEFLGDAVLQQVVTLELFHRFPELSEGDLAKRRAALVSTVALAEVARRLDLGPYIRLGNGEIATGGHAKASILADVVEALIGATYLSRGQDAATKLVLHLVGPLFDEVDRFGASMDPKTALQEHADRAGMPKPVYTVESTGPDHARVFTASVSFAGDVAGTGEGSSKKVAEAAAALVAWEAISANGR